MDPVARVRAARGAVNMSLDDFATAIGIGRQTLIRIENGTRTPRDHEYAAMAEVSGLPIGFFYADLGAVLSGSEDPTLSDRVAGLEAQITELRAGLVALSADNLLRIREQQEKREMGPQPGLQGGDG